MKIRKSPTIIGLAATIVLCFILAVPLTAGAVTPTVTSTVPADGSNILDYYNNDFVITYDRNVEWGSGEIRLFKRFYDSGWQNVRIKTFNSSSVDAQIISNEVHLGSHGAYGYPLGDPHDTYGNDYKIIYYFEIEVDALRDMATGDATGAFGLSDFSFTVQATPPQAILYPSNGAIDVNANNLTLTMTFDEYVFNNTVPSGDDIVIYQYDAGETSWAAVPKVDCTVTIEDNIVSIVPNTLLDTNTTFGVAVAGNKNELANDEVYLEDLISAAFPGIDYPSAYHSNFLGFTDCWTFKTASDYTSEDILLQSTQPAAEQEQVETDTDLTMIFSEVVSANTVGAPYYLTIKEYYTNSTVAQINVTDFLPIGTGRTTVTVPNSSFSLEKNKRYYVEIDTNAFEHDGKYYAGISDKSWNFSTATTNDVLVSAGTNGSVAPSGTVSVNYDDDLLITPSPNTGYKVSSVTSAGGHAVTDNGNGTYTIQNVQTTDTVTVKFSPNTYTVAFNGNTNDGGSTFNQSFVYDTAQDLTANGFTKTGYSFAGWATSVTGAVVYTDTENVNNLTAVDGDTVTLFAQWTPNTYTVTFNGNTNDGGSTSDQSFVYDTAQDLTANGFTKTGYSFAGWATSATGAVVYTNTENVNNLTAVDGDTVTLFAQWTPNTYTVTFNGNTNDGGSTSDQSFVYDTAQDLIANGFTKTGYSFAGWATSATGAVVYTDTENVNNLTAVDSDTVTLFAQWTQDIYTITYAPSGGAGSISSMTGVYDEVVTLSDGSGYSKPNAVLEEWDIGKLSGLYKITSHVTANAVWADDTDGDGISDADEIAANTDPNDVNDYPNSGTIAGTVLDLAGLPEIGMTVVLNSTPQTTMTDANGEFVFTNVSFAPHTLSLRRSNTEVAQYRLDFTSGTPGSVAIINSGSTSATSGHTSTIATSRLVSLDLAIQLNDAGYWELTGADITQRALAVNPKMGGELTWYEKIFNWLR